MPLSQSPLDTLSAMCSVPCTHTNTLSCKTLYFLNESSLAFPDLSFALSEPNGLLALGGDLTPERLVEAYANGIFPWYSDDEPIMWWSPDPRAIIPTDEIYINKTLRKFLNLPLLILI